MPIFFPEGRLASYKKVWKVSIRKVQTGDYNHRARVVSNDEIGVLGDGINKMTVGLVEGEALRHSYNLAREAQLAFLPGSPPVIEGLDIVTDVNRQLVCDVEESCQFMALFYLNYMNNPD